MSAVVYTNSKKGTHWWFCSQCRSQARKKWITRIEAKRAASSHNRRQHGPRAY
jgi:hypothetical protein